MDTGEVKILLVDDNPEVLGLWSAALERAGYRTSTASNGEEALEKLRQDRFQVCVLDLKMPGIGGMEVLEWIQKTGLRIRVIVVTIHSTHPRRFDTLFPSLEE